MSGSASASADFDESFDFGMDVFLGGLPALLRKQRCAVDRRRDGALSAVDFRAGAHGVNGEKIFRNISRTFAVRGVGRR
jgi:hypothetical protein